MHRRGGRAKLNFAAVHPGAPRHRVPSGRRDRPRGARRRRHQQPDRAILQVRSTIRPALAARRRGGAAGGPRAIRAERRPRRVPRAPRQTSSDAIRKLDADPQDRPRASRPGRSRSSRCGCRSTTCTGRRRWWSRSADSRARNRSASACTTAACCRYPTWGARTRAAHRPLRRRLRQSDREQRPGTPASSRRHPRRAARPADRCRAWRVVLENKTGRDAGDGRRLLLSAEPAQPRDAIAAAARLLVQADDLSRGAEPTACSPTRWSRTAPVTYPPIGGVHRYTPPDRLVVAAQL